MAWKETRLCILKDLLRFAGDTIGIHVTDFSEEKSSVMILKNGRPVCTKYHYERNHSLFFPTIVIEHGPVELIVQWQTAVSEIPNYIYVSISFQFLHRYFFVIIEWLSYFSATHHFFLLLRADVVD